MQVNSSEMLNLKKNLPQIPLQHFERLMPLVKLVHVRRSGEGIWKP